LSPLLAGRTTVKPLAQHVLPDLEHLAAEYGIGMRAILDAVRRVHLDALDQRFGQFKLQIPPEFPGMEHLHVDRADARRKRPLRRIPASRGQQQRHEQTSR
jgi:hypothetical protein